jgi:hypothetical protein
MLKIVKARYLSGGVLFLTKAMSNYQMARSESPSLFLLKIVTKNFGITKQNCVLPL